MWIPVKSNEKLDSYWEFLNESEIEGILKEIRPNLGEYGSTLYVLETQKEGLVGVWSKATIDNQMDVVSIGDPIKIDYLGTRIGKKGDYHDFIISKWQEKDKK